MECAPGETLKSLIMGEYSTIGMAPDGRFAIAWIRNNNHIRARLFDRDGTPQGDDFAIDGGGNSGAKNPVAVMNAAGEYTPWPFQGGILSHTLKDFMRSARASAMAESFEAFSFTFVLSSLT